MASGGGDSTTSDIPTEASQGTPALELHPWRPAHHLGSLSQRRAFFFAGQIFGLFQIPRNRIHYFSVSVHVNIRAARQGVRFLLGRENRLHYS
jgi:hypothetical protein